MAGTRGVEIGWLFGPWDPVKAFSSIWFSVLTISEGSGKSDGKGAIGGAARAMLIAHIEHLQGARY